MVFISTFTSYFTSEYQSSQSPSWRRLHGRSHHRRYERPHHSTRTLRRHLPITLLHNHPRQEKLNNVKSEIKSLISTWHPKLLSIYAVKLNLPHSSGLPQLMVLMEQAPALTMHHVLQDCESLRKDRASVRRTQTSFPLLHIFKQVYSLRTTWAKSSPP